jgi:hypothetical protein
VQAREGGRARGRESARAGEREGGRARGRESAHERARERDLTNARSKRSSDWKPRVCERTSRHCPALCRSSRADLRLESSPCSGNGGRGAGRSIIRRSEETRQLCGPGRPDGEEEVTHAERARESRGGGNNTFHLRVFGVNHYSYCYHY